MKQVSSTELINFLKTKGYYLHHTKGSHFVLINPNTSRIVVPYRKELPIGTILAILREAKISKKEYLLFFIRK
ncbi:MAG: type II toxin-antitoxin system HicA family toxin [Candidatus Iainarchaeum sp.]|jgi:predicted RNA binding protein YcfA (HicA-like mRNA interferase family)|nr:MAG: YcfA-like protein [archaeon ADurb.Bin336]